MARTKKAEIAARYNQQEQAAKRKYIEERGYKFAYNWKNTPEAKRFAKNKRQAIERYDDKRLTKQIEKDVFSKPGPEEITKFDNIVDQDFFFTEMYAAPGEGDSFVINQFRLAQAGTNKPVRAIIQDEDGSVKVYRTLWEFDAAMSDLYRELTKRQTEDYKAANKAFRSNPANEGRKLPKSGFIRLISINSGETDKYEILTVKIDKP